MARLLEGYGLRVQKSVFEAVLTPEQREVLRVGTFSAFAEGDFLRYIPETGELLVLSRQPAAHLRSDARDFATTTGLAPVTVDPTRGSLLGMLSFTPSLRERIDQGGTIALIIIGLGVLGLLMAAWRGAYSEFSAKLISEGNIPD